MKHDSDSSRRAAFSPHEQQQINTIELSLCHIGELINMAQEIASEMHGSPVAAEAIPKISGRLSTLMHSASREVREARLAVGVLIA